MMRDVSIVGIGMTPVGEHWESSLRELGAKAGQAALENAGVSTVGAVYVGNAYGSQFNRQSHVGALVADFMNLKGVESFSIDAGDGSGGAAIRAGYLAVASGLVESALVIGVEKSTDIVGNARTQARNISLDADFESVPGATLPAIAALLMRRYMYENGIELDAFEGFSVNAHANGNKNPNAMYRNRLRPGAFMKAPMVAEPVSLFDGAPDGDGAAAVVLVAADRAADMVPKPIQIVGSAVATDTFMLQDRQDMLHFDAVAVSTEKALEQADMSTSDIDLFELHDAFTIMSVLSLEACEFAQRGRGWELVNQLGLDGDLPVSTFGGLKSRGNPAGATGVYQIVEACLQLRGEAKENQISNASIAMTQNLAGIANTAVTHILRV